MSQENKMKNKPENNVAIELINVSKSFRINHEIGSSTLKSVFANPFEYLKKRTYTYFHALKNINLKIQKGESVGFIGANGSGKSTTLKIIAGIYEADSGKVKVQGRIVPFLELGVGFNPELTARENIFLNGTILGMTRNMIKQRFDEIVRFAEIEEFLDTQIKKFSSGMLVRLAFSIAIRAEGDIYILDEILSVGDSKFQEKSRKEFEKLRKEGKTVIFVSHNMDAIKEFCTKVVLLKNGELIETNSVQDTVDMYLNG